VISDLLAGPFTAVAGLLVVGGASKLRRPAPAARALSAAGFPRASIAARVLGAVELSVGATSLIAPRPVLSGAVALLYLSFAAFLAAALSGRVTASSCGCLGARDIPPSALHLLLDLAGAAVALLAVVWPPADLVAVAHRLPLFGIPFIAAVALAGYLAYLAVSYFPLLFSSYRGHAVAAPAVDGRGP
jgi:hypothetical protein